MSTVRRRTHVRFLAALGGSLVCARALLGCGARTGLLVLEGRDAEAAIPDSQVRVARDAAVDATADVQPDTSIDVVEDLPSIDVIPADVVVVGCVDAGSTLIYLMTSTQELLSFFPPTLEITDLGPIECPTSASPNSMGVDRQGTAYVNFTDGTLFQVSTSNVACVSTNFNLPASFATHFGMGYVGNPADGGDLLHVAADFEGTSGTTPSILATIDTTSFALNEIGNFEPNPILAPELTGTGDGRLFTFSANPGDPASSLVTQVDPNTAEELASSVVPGVSPGSDYAFAFYGGKFYIFTSEDGQTTQINLFDPVSQTATLVANTQQGQAVVGAGVSTCAPMR
jgi:hypothetical protein